MKKIILGLLAMAVVGLSGCSQPIETEIEPIAAQTTTVVRSYDLNGDGVLTDSEYQTYMKSMSAGSNVITTEELESAVTEASTIIDSWDTDEDGDLSYEESLSVMQKIFAKYDNGEITNPELRTILEGFERKVNELNSYYELFDEVGLKGPRHYIELRPENE